MGSNVTCSPSTLTIKMGTSPFNFPSNELILKFLRQQMSISKFISDVFQKNTRCWGEGGGTHPSMTLNFKTDTRSSDHQFNESPLKFIRSPFLYIPYIPPSINYNPSPEGSGGEVVTIEDIISGPFNYVEQNGYLKIWIGCDWWNDGRGRGVSCRPITFDY